MWQNGFDTNLFGHVMLARRAHEHLKRSPWPSIIYFSSESAHVGLTGRWIYPATKAAIEQVDAQPGARPRARSHSRQCRHAGLDREAVAQDRAARDQGSLRRSVGSSAHDRPSGHARGGGRRGTVPVLGARGLHHRQLSAGGWRTSALGPQGKEKHLPTEARKSAGVAYQADVR